MIRMPTVQILMVRTLVCVVAGIVEMGPIALVSAFTVMIDNNQNKLKHLSSIVCEI